MPNIPQQVIIYTAAVCTARLTDATAIQPHNPLQHNGIRPSRYHHVQLLVISSSFTFQSTFIRACKVRTQVLVFLSDGRLPHAIATRVRVARRSYSGSGTRWRHQLAATEVSRVAAKRRNIGLIVESNRSLNDLLWHVHRNSSTAIHHLYKTNSIGSPPLKRLHGQWGL